MTTEGGAITFGQYQLIEKIAQGGMAEIFRGQALDATGLERPVVIKRILPNIAANPEFVQMLIEEAKIAVMLSHGNIAQVYDLGKVADDYFIVMEYVEGKTISQIVKRLKNLGKAFPIPYAIYLCSEIAQGLDYIHRKTDENGEALGIVHRDISPQNAILSTSGTVKIIDFGIAKAEGKVSSTDSGVLKGKFAYMSPEHASGEKLDQRTDIFSLGVILFELLTGERLFKGKTNIDTLRRVRRTKVPLPSSMRQEVPTELDSIVLKSLQRERDKRYPSAALMAQDLTRVLIQNYPSFHPRELIHFLKDHFPELVPQESGMPEEPSLQKQSSLEKAAASHEEVAENTQQANSEILQKKLNEAEVFDVPERTIPLPETEVKKIAELQKIEREVPESIVQKLPTPEEYFWTPFKKTAATIAALAVILVIFGVGVIKILKESPVTPSKNISITENTQNKNLPPSPPPPTQEKRLELLVTSTPPGAEIYINDQDTYKKTPFHFKNISPQSSIKVGLYLSPYEYWENEVSLNTDSASLISAALKINYGELEINSLPFGADLMMDGKIIGKTPYALKQVLPDTVFSISISKDGYEPFARSIKIFPGKKEVINATLKKIIEE